MSMKILTSLIPGIVTFKLTCHMTVFLLDNNEFAINYLKTYLFTTTSRLVLGPTQTPVQWIIGVFSGGNVVKPQS
jgi:hypothetical protein